MADPWNPDRYGKFEGEREAPFSDLVEGIRLSAGKRILDLGCGTGALTARLHGRFKARETLGVDSSPAMLAKAPLGARGCASRGGPSRRWRPRRPTIWCSPTPPSSGWTTTGR